MAEYRLSPKARDDMEGVWLYSLSEWGAVQTQLYFDSLVDGFAFLLENPSTGIVCNDIRKGYRRYRVKRHVIYCKQTSYGVKIIRILHDRMSAIRLL